MKNSFRKRRAVAQKSLPMALPSLGCKRRFQVSAETLASAVRTEPSQKPTRMARLSKLWAMSGVHRHCLASGASWNVEVASSALAGFLAAFWPKNAANLVLGAAAYL